jgi:hypothetical protein
MQINEEEVFVRVPHMGAEETTVTPSQSRLGIQRATVTLAVSIASFFLALGGVAVSLFMYENSLKGLQFAQTDVQRGTVSKLANETKTTAAEARYAEEMNRLQTANEHLRTELLTWQTALARAERDRAAADAGLKGIDLGLSSGTIGDPEFQKAVARVFQQFVTPIVDCLSAKPDESKEAFQKRCRGKDLGSLFGNALSHRSNSDPFGLLPPGPTLQPGPPTAKRKRTERLRDTIR